MECRCIAGFSRLLCSMARFLFRFRWHILFWIAYFIGWTWLSISSFHTPVGIALAVTLAWFIGQATMIYTILYRWMPRYLRPRRLGLFFSAVAFSILSSAVFTAPVTWWLVTTFIPAFPYSFWANFGYVLVGNLYWTFLAVAAKVFRDRLRSDRRNQRLEKEHTENELRFLKSQMNPHFLFNAINSIYVLIRKDPGLAEHTLARFSDMLRYQLYDCATDYIPIEKEITYLENYMQLEQLRKGPALNIDYCAGPAGSESPSTGAAPAGSPLSAAPAHFSIAPLLLMPLVENAFKFVSSFTDRENKVHIRLSFYPPEFHFEIGNTVDEPPANAREPIGSRASGIGLENVRRRLELLYPKRHSLSIGNNGQYYTVSLKLQVV
jgi:two-component system, LytTR family, sensor kinase